MRIAGDAVREDRQFRILLRKIVQSLRNVPEGSQASSRLLQEPARINGVAVAAEDLPEQWINPIDLRQECSIFCLGIIRQFLFSSELPPALLSTTNSKGIGSNLLSS